MAYDPVPLKFSPGVVKDKTRRANELGYWDADLMRWVEGLPQTIGGWQRITLTDPVRGTPRTLFGWTDLDGQQLMGVGTQLKYYIESGGGLTDVTPIRKTTSPLANNPIATTNGSGTVTITDAGHGANAGDFVTISGATAFNGLTTGQLNQEFGIITATVNTYDVATGGTANASSSGGGAAVAAAYQIGIGLDTTLVGTGYGAGSWGRGTWDSMATVSVQGAQLRIWTQDNWGEDLVFCPRYGAMYWYDRSSPARGVEIGTLGGATDVPDAACQVLSFGDTRFLLAFGCTPAGGTDLDEMVWRWASQETVMDWDPTSTNTAGGNRFLIGSRFIQAVKTREEALAFTDRALYAVSFIGAPDYFSQRLLSPNIKIAGPKAAGFYNDAVYWMGTRGFNYYDGAVHELPCPLKEFVFRDINLYQLWKCHCAVNILYGEIWWFYCSASSEEIDRYVMIKIPEGYWANGTLSRTAWLDADTFTLPRAATPSPVLAEAALGYGAIYDHETGNNADSVAMEPFIETSPFLVGDGGTAMRIKSLWPDMDFLDSTNVAPQVNLVLKLQDKPGTAIHGTTTAGVVRTVSTPIEVFTDRLDIGKRARMIAFRLESNQTDLAWRGGISHMELTPDGRR